MDLENKQQQCYHQQERDSQTSRTSWCFSQESDLDLTESLVLPTNSQEAEGSEGHVKQDPWGTAAYQVQILGTLHRFFNK